MKKKMLRKLRETCNELIGEEETKPKRKTKKGDK